MTLYANDNKDVLLKARLDGGNWVQISINEPEAGSARQLGLPVDTNSTVAKMWTCPTGPTSRPTSRSTSSSTSGTSTTGA
ncbi:MAG UNVERIFIED_CONTAM: hypothetical protein LVR18_37560 [Planctomycetaceae bacterium]